MFILIVVSLIRNLIIIRGFRCKDTKNNRKRLVNKEKLSVNKEKVTFRGGKATFSFIRVVIYYPVTTFLILFILLPSHACHSASR